MGVSIMSILEKTDCYNSNIPQCIELPPLYFDPKTPFTNMVKL